MDRSGSWHSFRIIRGHDEGRRFLSWYAEEVLMNNPTFYSRLSGMHSCGLNGQLR